jgi:hypothetical protein
MDIVGATVLRQVTRLRAVQDSLGMFIKVNFHLTLTRPSGGLHHSAGRGCGQPRKFLKPAGIIMSRVIAAAFATALVAIAVPTAASAGCYSCYAPPQPCCQQQYQQQVVPPQYRTVQETVMVSPGRVIAHRTPAQYRTVMVPKTVMVAPEGVAYERTAPEYATQERVEMVAPARAYYVPVAPRCNSCGY